jgi:murein DD-endopeptidase MepM/ murein hydrolase activator NlpD
VSVSVRSRTAQPGELLALTITVPAGVGTPTVDAFGATWPVARMSATRWRSLVGIDLDQAPGEYTIAIGTVDPAIRTVRREIVVRSRAFRRRVLKVAPDYVNPSPTLLTRITTEADLLRTVYDHSSDAAAWADGFVRPVPQRANSSFGTRSVFNGEPRSPHAGTDFLSPAGTPIHAPAGGRIAVARNLFFTGNTVIVDHGLGVFSMLAHLSRVDVHEGDTIARGQTVGLVGATGRVTGPHLHWALRVGPARVDALSALAVLGARSSAAPRN